MSRVVVIGAGLGGLAAAARLAASGHAVTVCESAGEVGGKLGCARFDGYRFDTGPSLLTMPHLLRDVFEDTGGWPDALRLERIEPTARYVFADGTSVELTTDVESTCARLDERLAPGSGADWRRLLAHGERVWRATAVPFLQRPNGGARALAGLAVRRPRDIPVVAPGRTLRGLGRTLLRDARLRLVLERYATYTGSDPRRAPAALAAIPYLEQVYGGWHVHGGLHRIAAELQARAVERGAQVRLRTRVARVETTGGRATGVVLDDGGRLPADVVVANADASTVYGQLVTGEPARRAARRATAAVPSLSGFVLLLALAGRPGEQAPHTVVFPSDYDAEMDAVFGSRAAPVADPTLYLSVPPDDAMRPPDGEACFVLVNAPRHGTGPGAVDWRAPGVASSYADHLVHRLEERGFAVRHRTTWSSAVSPADLEERTGAPGGAIYGASSNGVRSAFLRPANASPVPGLFLVGGSAHPGGGIPLVLMSARIVADLVGPA